MDGDDLVGRVDGTDTVVAAVDADAVPIIVVLFFVVVVVVNELSFCARMYALMSDMWLIYHVDFNQFSFRT